MCKFSALLFLYLFSSLVVKGQTHTIIILTDKEIYQPGETVWLGMDLQKKASESDMTLATVYIELLNAENLSLNHALLFGMSGKTNGYITLPTTADMGKYRIRAFTRNAITRQVGQIGYQEISIIKESTPVTRDALTLNSDAKIQPDSSANDSLAFRLLGSKTDAGYYSISVIDRMPFWASPLKKEVNQDILTSLENTESGIPISGTVYNLKNNPIANAAIRIMTSNGMLLSGKTDSIGKFYTNQLFHLDSVNLIILAKRNKKEILDIEIDPLPSFQELIKVGADKKVTNIIENKQSSETRLRTTGRMLNEVVIKSRKDRFDKARSKLYDKEFGVTTIDMKDMPPGYSNLAEVLKGRIAGVRVDANGAISIRNGEEPLFLINGMFAEREQVDMLSPFHIAFIDVLKGPEVAVFGSRGGGGVIAIYTKTGELDEDDKPADGGSVQLRYPGFQKPMGFKRSDLPSIAGIPKTWYWNPSVKTDENGIAKFSFPKPDKPGVYWIKAEGFSADGKYCYATYRFEVKEPE